MLALFGKSVCHLDELPPPVGQAIGEDRLQLARQIPREGVTHLDRRRQFCHSPEQYVFEVFSGVLATAEEQGDLVPFAMATIPR